MNSPEFVKTSLAAAMTLGFKEGSFHRGAKLRALNLLLTYQEGCSANCAYCGLSRSRGKESTFIRVLWPTYSVDAILERALQMPSEIHRICVSMITNKRAVSDMCAIIKKIRVTTPFPVSALVTPTTSVQQDDWLAQLHDAGADRIGIAIDAATEPLFEQFRGKGVSGPHKWDVYWDAVEQGVQVFGDRMVGIHSIVGLGETEEQAVSIIQRAHDMGAPTHLFSFFPERGTALGEQLPPSLGAYRRVQLARYLINEEKGRMAQMHFNQAGQLMDFGVAADEIEPIIFEGEAFMTSGCPGADGKVACNRPYGNERPSQAIRNFPFLPEAEDIGDIRLQLKQY